MTQSTDVRSIVGSGATLKVVSARDIGPQFVDNPHRMVGQDGAFSIPLDQKESLWFFGDTLVGTRPNHSLWLIDGELVGARDMTGRGTFEQMINNTGLILPTQHAGNGLRDYRYLLDDSGRLKNLLPLEAGEHHDADRIWCQHGICIGEHVYLSFIKVRMLEQNPGPLPIGFEIVGSGIAASTRGEWRFARMTRPDGDSILWRAHEPHFASAFLKHPTDGLVYLYGTVIRGQTQQCYLACVDTADVDKWARYKYFAGMSADGSPRWSTRVADATAIFTGMPSELSVSYNVHLGKFLAVHSLDLSGQIVARTASRPWGPWSQHVTLWQVDAKHEYPRPYSFPLVYAGKEHPELAREGGRVVYVTYIEFEEYFPHLVEVTFA